ncbi:MAG: bacillithiol biosynthesis deacetylase BshB1 [Calditrichaeota bacterium]|nr:bacillithiol biosynthesis deacetylase BshB1 [Calditrichota bacterium]MCB0296669.1 bacillithiol biosynthesis deacetylase BshB1 [Calditrichota bacterium]MCB0302775.1 bacillithiol biosynthesis deacetylase BshB1 [Calditrichota bacterium]MCB0312621.1 bacillithiol biosynthesis deacetylase BshB1 [Calditrichota bacterium]MCB9090379.1 bacillithiol biosynthesis deacetylase BshB1 [Calditrichia bacterium]
MIQEQLDVLAFGPHPDDVELGCGGTLAKLAGMGYATGIIDLTRGEMGTRGTVAEREREAADAAQILGARLRENLAIPDADIRNTPENRRKLIDAVRKYRPALVFAPNHDDRHPDHRHAAQLITEACFYAGVEKIAPGPYDAFRPRRVIYYMITYEFEPSFLVDISAQYPQKLAAIKAHRSQFYNPAYPGRETFISSPEYLEAVEFRMRHYGWKAGVKYAEPLRVREAILLDDLFTALAGNKM